MNVVLNDGPIHRAARTLAVATPRTFEDVFAQLASEERAAWLRGETFDLDRAVEQLRAGRYSDEQVRALLHVVPSQDKA